jgi:hypothetical protein
MQGDVVACVPEENRFVGSKGAALDEIDHGAGGAAGVDGAD